MFRMRLDHEDNQPHVNDLLRAAEGDRLAAQLPPSRLKLPLVRLYQSLFGGLERWSIFCGHRSQTGMNDKSVSDTPPETEAPAQQM